MCKILSNDKKREQKKIPSKRVLIKKITQSDINETITCNFNCMFENTQNSTANEDNPHMDEKLDDAQNNLINKREKSRIAAKKRRNLESDNLSELYISIPVATQSKLLTCYDNQFIGNFEKATIIKISAYVLNLYNSLSNILFDNSLDNHSQPLFSLFSQSIFGLFWCEKTKKLIFSSPGLSRLTGLYWCNMIGMPHSSIIVESGNQDSSNIIFLRFIMGALKDRGIFTVNPQKSANYKQSSDYIKSEKSPILNNQMKQDFIGKLPCSVWCSQKLSDDITFNLIQPLILKPEVSSVGHRVIQSYQLCPYRLPVFDTIRYFNKKHQPHKFISYHCLDSLGTISICGDVQTCLGYKDEHFSKSSLLSLFHCDDIVQVTRHINELLSGEKRTQMGIARLCTPKIDMYRWSRYVLQINRMKNGSETGVKINRSNLTESFSQNMMRISNSLNNTSDDFCTMDSDHQNFWLEASFSMLHYFQEYQPGYASIMKNEICHMNTDYMPSNNISNGKNFLPITPDKSYEESKWFNVSSNSIGTPFDFMRNEPTLFRTKSSLCYNSQRQDPILHCCV